MKKAERIELGASAVAYCYKQGHDTLNLSAVLDMYKTYSLETCEKILERAKQLVRLSETEEETKKAYEKLKAWKREENKL